MIKKILEKMIIFYSIVGLFCMVFIFFEKEIKQPQTFLENESYQLAKHSIGSYGRICYKYANRMKKLYPEVEKEHIIIHYRGYDTLTHYRVILFRNNNLTIYTDSNQKGERMIRTWYEFN